MTNEVRDLDTFDLEALDEETAQNLRGGESWAYEAGHAVGEALEDGVEAMSEAMGPEPGPGYNLAAL
jgi:hypothetical protein